MPVIGANRSPAITLASTQVTCSPLTVPSLVRVQYPSALLPHYDVSILKVKRHEGSVQTRAFSCPSIVSGLGSVGWQDIAATTVATLAGVLVVSSIKWLENNGIVHKTLSRKLVHSVAGPGFLLFWPFFGPSLAARFISSITPALNGLSLYLAGSQTVEDERFVSAISRSGNPTELLRGPLYYTIVLTMVTVFLWRESLISVAIVSIMCGGDGLADILGRSLGKDLPLPWNQQKSWPGTIAMFFGGFSVSVLLTLYFSYFGFVSYDWVTIQKLAVLSGSASILESLPINHAIDDNVSVPIFVALLGYFIL